MSVISYLTGCMHMNILIACAFSFMSSDDLDRLSLSSKPFVLLVARLERVVIVLYDVELLREACLGVPGGQATA